MENVISLLEMETRENHLITGSYFWHFLQTVKLRKVRKDSIFSREKDLDFEMLSFIFSCRNLLLQF